MVTNANDALENTPAAVGTLRQALFNANQNPDSDTINFSAGLNGGTITLTQGELTITESLTVDASTLASGITINAGRGVDDVLGTEDGFRIFNVAAGSPALAVTLKKLKLTGGDTFDRGGAISSRATRLRRVSPAAADSGSARSDWTLARALPYTLGVRRNARFVADLVPILVD